MRPAIISRRDISGLHALAEVVVAAPDRLPHTIDAFQSGYLSPSPTLVDAINALKHISSQAGLDLQKIIADLDVSHPALARAVRRAKDTYDVHQARLNNESD